MAMTRPAQLCRAALHRVPAASRPLVPPDTARAGIVHLGLGAFHRAHQAVYTEEAIAAAGGDWAIVAVAPRRRQLAAALAAQDGLFSVTSLDRDGAHTRVVGAVTGARHAPSDPAAVVALLADPATRVVTLTVTEKAYLLEPGTGRLLAGEQLRAELAGRRDPATVPGLLACGLRERARTGAGPVALVSCDNLPANGRTLASAMRQTLALAGEVADAARAAEWSRTVEWMHASARFPGTMVDRIVPATTPETLATAQAALGLSDAAAVAAEPYRQWVIEDDFPGGRPAWDAAGAVLTSDAGPYERLKLRTLNGVHSALAYLGALAGYETIDRALAMPGLPAVLTRFVAEDVAPSLRPPDGVSVPEYGESVLARFANPATGHRTLQVAMDGSQKLPQRVLHTAVARRAAGATPRWAALVVAAWMRFVAGYADDGRPLPLDDPLADEIRKALAGAGGSPAGTVEALLQLEQVFPAELAGDEVMRRSVTGWFAELSRHGVAGTLAGIGGQR